MNSAHTKSVCVWLLLTNSTLVLDRKILPESLIKYVSSIVLVELSLFLSINIIMVTVATMPYILSNLLVNNGLVFHLLRGTPICVIKFLTDRLKLNLYFGEFVVLKSYVFWYFKFSLLVKITIYHLKIVLMKLEAPLWGNNPVSEVIIQFAIQSCNHILTLDIRAYLIRRR